MPNENSLPNRAKSPADRPSGAPPQCRDLCSNCDNAAEHAASGGRPQRPIFFCEEFEVFATPPIAEPDRVVENRLIQTQRDGGRMGLCANCENAPTCTLPRPEGGVWHCEEYL